MSDDNTNPANPAFRAPVGSVIESMAVELKAKEFYRASLPGGPECKHRRYPEWRDLPEAERDRWRQCVNRAEAIAAATVHIDRLPNTTITDRPESRSQQRKDDDGN